MKPSVLPILAITIFCISGTAISAASTNSAWSVRVWQSDEGLPNDTVTGLAQAPDGYIWIATPGRLARFDGARFEGYAPKNIVPYDRKITTVLSSASSGLWLGMEHGPMLRLSSGIAHIITNVSPNITADAMAEDADGSVWVIFRGNAAETLCRFKGDKLVQSWPAGTSRSLASDKQGRIWVIRDGQLFAARNGTFASVALFPNRASRLAAASDGGLWICSGSQLLKFHEGQPPAEMGTINPPDTRPMVVLEDHTGAVWVGTLDDGLFRFADGKFTSVPTSHREILSLLEDRERNLWVGTGGGGLNRIQPRAIELEGVENGLPFASVQSLCEDTRGEIWAATQNGLLAQFKNGAWTRVATNAAWRGERVTCVTADNQGALWLGTSNRKLIRIDPDGRFKVWTQQDGLNCRQIHSLLAARTGDLWFAGNAPDALQRVHDGQLENFPVPPDVHVLRAMAEDSAGNIWVGSSKGTLLRITGKQVFDESVHVSGLQWSIRSLYSGPDGSLWIGYSGWGLGRLKDGHFSHVAAQQGLHDDQISQMVADDRGWLWIGAESGIFKIRQQEFEDVAAGRSPRLHSIHYGQNEGLPSLEGNFGATPGAMRSRDGRLWIPMRTALAVISPEKLNEDPQPPTVLVTRVVADDEVVAVYGGATPVRVKDLRESKAAFRFPPDHRRLEFDFTALSFASSENVEFQYRLTGFDDRWADAGNQRSVSYSRLPAGNYRFCVRACNRDGAWNETGASLGFVVAPFLWQRWWFRLTTLAAFTSIVIAMARYHSFRRLRHRLEMVEQQAALDRERARIARDIHDDLGCRLTKIVLLTEIALRNSSKGSDPTERVRQISSTAREGMQSLDETVWAINPRNDTLADLIDYIGQFAVELLEAADIRCHLDLPDHPPTRSLSAEVRHNLFLAVKEALNNIVRHSHAREVRLRVTTNGNSLNISIEDDGRGFEQAPDNALADGLRNMRQRLQEVSGECRIESKPGSGTRISFEQPWQNGN